MVGGAEVTTEAVADLARDLRAYASNSGRAHVSARRGLDSAVSFVEEVVATRRRAAQSARSELDAETARQERARRERERLAALERERGQESSAYGWSLPQDTSWQDEAALAELRRRLRECEIALERAQRISGAVSTRAAEVRRLVASHANATGQIVDKTIDLLGLEHAQLETYLSQTSAPGGAFSAVSTPAAIEGPASVADAALPEGFAMVSLADIDDNGRVTGPESFGKGYSPRDLEWAHEAFLEVVLPTLRAGGGIDDLRLRDANEGKVGTRSFSDTFGGFLGDSAIRLTPIGDRWEITNGAHRIWVARHMGLESIPARIGAAHRGEH
ncbi:hypothetical protein [Frondihabitans australicus]|uniref:Uncharacterized protein n=1 Tax=Frondihabitans australicus TaxID=386892 RepID=A0A495IJY9_9MICO|nr:hypothetical protein [Frondihabitans australicus]RKR76284.1 hypothetical protein C8E83_3451 [Frondihabitans australicus]